MHERTNSSTPTVKLLTSLCYCSNGCYCTNKGMLRDVMDVIAQIRARTEKFLSSFYPNCICEWNKLDPEIRLAPSVAVFKAKFLSKNLPPPPAKSIFCIHDPIGLGYLFQLRVGLSKFNFHKFNHNFRYTSNPMPFE